jgi:metal-responsive CopG/Arc/MetJ family transcriptional regulator
MKLQACISIYKYSSDSLQFISQCLSEDIIEELEKIIKKEYESRLEFYRTFTNIHMFKKNTPMYTEEEVIIKATEYIEQFKKNLEIVNSYRIKQE